MEVLRDSHGRTKEVYIVCIHESSMGLSSDPRVMMSPSEGFPWTSMALRKHLRMTLHYVHGLAWNLGMLMDLP